MLQNAPTEIDKFKQSIGDASSNIDTSDMIDQQVTPGKLDEDRLSLPHPTNAPYQRTLSTHLSTHAINTPSRHSTIRLGS